LAFQSSGNPEIQKHDVEWDCFLDTDNDDAISDCDKLKIVTLPGRSLTHHAKEETTQQKCSAIMVCLVHVTS